ncbi:MAG: U32 family peptidase, partial [Clostridia bacterium]|nr:U32 family peptidase [Clostridia bacterium]
MKNSIEILSPAGEPESLMAAVNNGADAVYVGGSSFSARKSAVNFTDEQLQQAVQYAHLRGVKVYVALNTLIHESELVHAYEFIKYCGTIGVDALIVQDLGIVYMRGRYFPHM